ncbi:MAG: S1 RNA-binding domain-containing protein [Abitibacteriaceae bacterium]|nr:S1 RNA-binding domain-containing protein [Abditibacteriaceae bacterium]MBV9866759.1 S1 RNA-binding domain-containing protein [Abditibacteriaceae bacterium]
MAVEVGQIVQGTVVRLLNYGVLVKLEDGTTGLVHISEIDQNYVRDVNDYFAVGDNVTVKILATGERGKVELSVKQARNEGDPPIKPRQNVDNGAASDGGGDGDRREADGPPMPRRESRASFEEKMNDFMRSSSERLSDLKRNVENKRGGKKTR